MAHLCEHGRRCISRGGDYDNAPEPIVTHFEGRRINSPNDIAVAPDGTIWFTDPTFGIIMPNQGVLADPELDHRSLYRFDPVSGVLARMADFEEPNGLGFTADGRTLYVSDTSYRLARSRVTRRVTNTRSSPSMLAKAARFPTGASSAKPIMVIPMVSPSIRGAGYGQPRRTACTSGRPIAASSDSFRPRQSRRTAHLGV
jgi:sugar lactone lactonase YvrE